MPKKEDLFWHYYYIGYNSKISVFKNVCIKSYGHSKFQALNHAIGKSLSKHVAHYHRWSMFKTWFSECPITFDIKNTWYFRIKHYYGFIWYIKWNTVNIYTVNSISISTSQGTKEFVRLREKSRWRKGEKKEIEYTRDRKGPLYLAWANSFQWKFHHFQYRKATS